MLDENRPCDKLAPVCSPVSWGFERNVFRQLLGYTRLIHMYRIVLACKGVPADVGAVAARDITEEFTPQAVAPECALRVGWVSTHSASRQRLRLERPRAAG